MKICFLIADISGSGGTERVTSVLANGLVQRGHEIEILSCRGGNSIKYGLDSAVSTYSLHAENIRSFVKRKIYVLTEIEKRINLKGFDFVIAVDVYLYLYLFLLRRHTPCKYIAWEHFNLAISNKRGTRIARALSTKYADAVVVLGKHDYDNYKVKYKKSSNITYIYNPVAFKLSFPADLNNHRLISVGRLTKQKGFDLLIEAWNLIENDATVETDWHLDIYGTGELEKALIAQINRYNLCRICLKGYSENIGKEMSESSGFILSSRYEGFVLVLLEAQAKGLPCVSFDCKEGPAEIITDGVNGYLSENGNVDELANKMKMIMNNAEIRKKFSNNAHKDLWRFELENVLDNWENLFNRILGENSI